VKAVEKRTCKSRGNHPIGLMWVYNNKTMNRSGISVWIMLLRHSLGSVA
jgi:hypothetical protein